MASSGNDSPGITLQEITFETVRAIISLSVSNEQSPYVAPNATSIAEGLLNPGSWIRAIYAGEVPVGFVMLLDPKVAGAKTRSPIDDASVFLWRLMAQRDCSPALCPASMAPSASMSTTASRGLD